MMQKNFLLILLAMCFASPFYAQDAANRSVTPRYLSTQKKFTVAFQPLQLFNWGLRTDFEMRLGDGPGWLQFGPTFYRVEREGDDHSYYHNSTLTNGCHHSFALREPFSKLRGAGLDVNYKRYIDPWRGLYMAAGLSYSHFDIGYNGEIGEWKDYMQDDLLYHEYVSTPGFYSQNIHRLGINHFLGYQIPSRHAFLFDVFGGISYRYSMAMDKNKPAFNDDTLSYGYTGFLLFVGVRFGIGIK
jgi:hypothetical protein